MNKIICSKCDGEISKDFGVSLSYCTNCGANIRLPIEEKTVSFSYAAVGAPAICPQCGGKITTFDARQNLATCGYCQTQFVIEPAKQPAAQPGFIHQTPKSPIPGVKVISIAAAVCLILGSIFFIAIFASRKIEPDLTLGNYSKPYTTPISPRSPAPTPNSNLLEFGGKGTGNGLFQDADAMAVDRQGRIYVADNSLRVQQFDEEGEFLKLWQIPSETGYYKRARSIEKIAVDDNDRLYVLMVGLVLVYENSSSEMSKIINFAPDSILDFAFRSDGAKLYLTSDGETESLYHITGKGKTVRRIIGFHTEAADAAMSPRGIGLAAIRLAVDGAGNIFSVYALGDLGSYQLSYNEEDFMIFRFTPEGKYVNKFVRTMNSCGIAVDNQSRVYISDNDSIKIYSNTGEQVSTVSNLPRADAFALDRQNNIYILSDDKVIKRAAVQ